MTAASDVQTGDLQTVVPPTRVLVIGGSEKTLQPVTLGQLPKVVVALKPLANCMSQVKGAAPDDIAALLLAALIDDPALLLNVLGATTGLPRDVLEAADLATGVELVTAVIELNADFFVTAVAPRLNNALAAAISAGKGAAPGSTTNGPTPSSA